MMTRKIETATLLPLMGDERSLIEYVKDLRPLTDLILPSEPRAALNRVLAENYRAADLLARGLRPANRILFCGPPGCGKTVSAGALALAMGVPLALVRLDGIVASYMGDTAKNLRKVFDFARREQVVMLVDEVDALGRARGDRDDVGEAKRVTNSLLVMIEEFAVQAGPKPSLMVAATNHESMLDPALWRRFDEVVVFPRPTPLQAGALLKQLVERYDQRVGTRWSPPAWKTWSQRLAGMSFADVERLALDAVKSTVLDESLAIDVALSQALERQRGRRALTKRRGAR